jgi:Icc-related predicted phosphoesterase
MAVKLIADPHGNFRNLAREVDEEDVLLVLGDILDLVDWADFSGILPEVVGKKELGEKLFQAFAAGPRAAVALREELIAPDSPYFPALRRKIEEQYRAFAAVLAEIGCRAFILYGNGDIPWALEECLREVPGACLAEGRISVEGVTFGFMPGALLSPFRMPAEMDDAEYGEHLEKLGKVDVLCTHIPPSLEHITMDVVAGRPVEGSRSLLRYLDKHRPAYHYHGHVHNPARRFWKVGDTMVVNVGYYKKEEKVYRHGEFPV